MMVMTAKVNFKKVLTILAAIAGVIIALILTAVVILFKKYLKKKLSPIRLILISAVLGIAFYGI